MVATDGADGLLADVSGVPHLFGGETGLRDDLQARLERAGLHAASAIAVTRGAAHALARHGGGIVPDGRLVEGIGQLPVTALPVDHATAEALARVGLNRPVSCPFSLGTVIARTKHLTPSGSKTRVPRPSRSTARPSDDR